MGRQLDMFQSKQETQLVPGLRYEPDFISLTDETRLLAEVDRRPWLADLKRRVQHYGYKYDYKARAISRSMFVGPLPKFAVDLAASLVGANVLSEMPDQLIVNEYLPGQGITPHVDCEPCFKERIVTVSLGSHCEMEFIPKDETVTAQRRMLEPRSALLIAGEARYEWLHTIRARLTDHGRVRARRVSLTFRNVILDEGDVKPRSPWRSRTDRA
jgi:alkylated DNA repair dioxygenase AlkB